MIFISHSEVMESRVAIVEIEGPLNSETSPDFEDYINKLLKKNFSFILLDAKKLKFLSSEGIGVFLFIQKKISENNGFFIIYNLSKEILSLYKLLGFDKVFRITENRSDAIQTMDRQIELRDKNKNEDQGVERLEIHDTHLEETPHTIEDENDFDDVLKKLDEHLQEDHEVDFSPFVVECANCKSLVRIKKSGNYICPSCKSTFSIMSDQSAVF